MDLYTVKTSSTPQQFSRILKERGPLFWSAEEKIWVVTDYQLANRLLKGSDLSADRTAVFMAQAPGCPFHKVAGFFSVVKKMMVNSDPPEHSQRRKLAHSGVHDHVLESFLPQVRKIVDSLLANLDDKSTIEFVDRVALPLPNIVLADLFSIPSHERPAFYQSANHMTQFFGGTSPDRLIQDAEAADHGAVHLRDYFSRLMIERRAHPKNDFISHLVRNQGDIADDEVLAQAVIMLVAGTITTTDQICNNLFGFLESGVWARLVSQPVFLEPALEEATRLDPAVNFIFRVAKNKITVGNLEIQTGQPVFISSHATNRCDATFASPDTLDLSRIKNPHLSYGAGIHHCLGVKLGRTQMQVLFSRLLEKFPNLHLSPDEPPRRKHQSLAFSGFSTFPLVLGES